jgi:prophage DNA circulation protein
VNSSLGNLVISLIAETAQYTAALGKAADQAEKTASRISSSFDSAKNAIGALAGAFAVDKVFEWSKGVVEAAENLNNLSAATGSSVESLSKLANQAKIAGTDFGTLQGFLFKLDKGMAESSESTSDAKRALAALGVTAKDPAEALQQVIDKMATYNGGIGKAALATALFGKSGQEFLATLDNMSKLGDVNATVTAKQAEEAEKLAMQIRRLTVEGGYLKQALLSDVVPALNEVIGAFRTARTEGLSFWQALSVATEDKSNIDDAVTHAIAQVDKWQKIVSDEKKNPRALAQVPRARRQGARAGSSNAWSI